MGHYLTVMPFFMPIKREYQMIRLSVLFTLHRWVDTQQTLAFIASLKQLSPIKEVINFECSCLTGR